jgi:glycerol-3-phosphate dehydrogenase (NAD(P)+)
VTKAAVFGTGSWGTAFAMVLADAGCEVTLWGRRAELAESVNTRRVNPDYLPGVELPATVRATTDPAEAADGAEFTVLAVPSQTLRGNLEGWAPLLRPDTVLVSLMKGVELGTAKRMSEVIEEVAAVERSRVAVLTGPNLAKEIAARLPAASVVACTDVDVAQRLQTACHTPYFRPYTNTDVVGCELGGAVKNVIALAYGIATAMRLGDNTKATLITRGLAEMTRLAVALGGSPLTLAGLSGLGDLVLTCTGGLSRNRQLGMALARGVTLAAAERETRMIAEGARTVTSALVLARRHRLELPICAEVGAVLFDGKAPQAAVAALLGRAAAKEDG